MPTDERGGKEELEHYNALLSLGESLVYWATLHKRVITTDEMRKYRKGLANHLPDSYETGAILLRRTRGLVPDRLRPSPVDVGLDVPLKPHEIHFLGLSDDLSDLKAWWTGEKEEARADSKIQLQLGQTSDGLINEQSVVSRASTGAPGRHHPGGKGGRARSSWRVWYQPPDEDTSRWRLAFLVSLEELNIGLLLLQGRTETTGAPREPREPFQFDGAQKRWNELAVPLRAALQVAPRFTETAVRVYQILWRLNYEQLVEYFIKAQAQEPNIEIRRASQIFTQVRSGCDDLLAKIAGMMNCLVMNCWIPDSVWGCITLLAGHNVKDEETLFYTEKDSRERPSLVRLWCQRPAVLEERLNNRKMAYGLGKQEIQLLYQNSEYPYPPTTGDSFTTDDIIVEKIRDSPGARVCSGPWGYAYIPMAAEFHQGSSVWPDGFQGLPPGGVLRFQGRRWNMLDDRDAEDDQRSPDNVEVPPAGWTAEERRFAHQAAQLFATYYNSRIRQMSASWRSHIQETYLDALFNHANLGGIAELLSGFFSCNTVIVSSDGTPICFNRNETKNFSPKVQSQLNAWYPRALEIESPSDLHRIYPELKNQQPWVHNGYVAPIQGASGRARGALLLWNADSEFGARQHNGSGAYIPPEFPPFLKPAVKDMARHLGILLERDAALPRYPGETERWNRLRLAWYRLVDLHRPHRGHPLPPPLQRLLRDAVYAVVGLEPAQDQAATKLNTSKTTLVRHCRELLHDPNATWPRLRKKAPAAPDINDEIERLEGLVRHIQELAAD